MKAEIEAEYIRDDKSINDLKKQIFAQIETNSKNLNLKFLAEFFLSKEDLKELEKISEKIEINNKLTKEELEDLNNESIKLKTKLQNLVNYEPFVKNFKYLIIITSFF